MAEQARRKRRPPASVPRGRPQNAGERFRLALWEIMEPSERRKPSVSQNRVAELMGCSRSGPTEWLGRPGRDPRVPDPATLARFCDVFRVSQLWILEGRGGMWQGEELPHVDLAKELAVRVRRAVAEQLQIELPNASPDRLQLDGNRLLQQFTDAASAEVLAAIRAHQAATSVAQAYNSLRWALSDVCLLAATVLSPADQLTLASVKIRMQESLRLLWHATVRGSPLPFAEVERAVPRTTSKQKEDRALRTLLEGRLDEVRRQSPDLSTQSLEAFVAELERLWDDEALTVRSQLRNAGLRRRHVTSQIALAEEDVIRPEAPPRGGRGASPRRPAR